MHLRQVLLFYKVSLVPCCTVLALVPHSLLFFAELGKALGTSNGFVLLRSKSNYVEFEFYTTGVLYNLMYVCMFIYVCLSICSLHKTQESYGTNWAFDASVFVTQAFLHFPPEIFHDMTPN